MHCVIAQFDKHINHLKYQHLNVLTLTALMLLNHFPLHILRMPLTNYSVDINWCLNKNVYFQLKKKIQFWNKCIQWGRGPQHLVSYTDWHKNKWYLRLILPNNTFPHTTHKFFQNPQNHGKKRGFQINTPKLEQRHNHFLQRKILRLGQKWCVFVYWACVWTVKQSFSFHLIIKLPKATVNNAKAIMRICSF